MLSFHKNNKLLHITWITLTLLICCFINDIKGQQDFQFDNDDQVVFTEATDIIENIQNKNYEKEIQKCLYNDDKIYLTFVLRSQLWSEIGEKNKDIAIQKLSNFFAVPKNFLSVDDVTTNDIHEITKLSTERGLNQLQSSNTKLGRLQFVIGCDQIFSTGQLIANQLPQQMKDGLISEISGLDFGWWVIWMKNARTKRQAPGLPLEGSGEDDYEYDDEEDMTEVPSTPPTHGHRHHHGEVLNKSPVATTSTEIPVTSTDIPQLGGGIETTTPDYIEYDDDDEDYDATTTATEKTTTQRFTIPITIPITTTQTPTTTVRTTIPTTTEKVLTTTEEYEEPINHPPFIKTRLPKLSFSAGQFKTYPIPIDTFSDEEDGYDLTIELFQENKTIVEEDSWIQYNPDKREIYALPLEEAVSKWNYLLYATDKGGSKIFENIDVTVQQNKYLRSANHEISVGVKLTEHFKYNIDWQIRLMNGIVQTLGDANSSNIIVRKIRLSRDHNSATFVFTNVTLPRNECPEKQMDNIVKILDGQTLANYVRPSMTINHVSGKLVNSCEPMIEPTKPTSHSNYPTSNHYPIVRNPIDRINATVGQLLVFKVPSDTFFDDEDKTDVIQNLKTINDTELHPKHWLQFDSKNTEFYGIPKSSDISENQYVLYGADRGGLKGRDVLVVVVSPAIKRDYSVLFEMTLGITYDRFNNSLAQRRFVEHISKIFGDHNTSNIQIRSIRSNHYTGNTIVSFYNTTLYRIHQRCPDEEIEILKNKYVHKDGSIRDATRELLGNEYNLLNMSILPIGTCQGGDTLHHDLHPMHPIHPIHTIHPTQVKTEAPPAQMKDDYLLTFVLPAVIILTMLLLASIVACVLHRRRLTGKMELGDEEERRSFRSKGIPVIFQDELDEKPEIGNKSPIIMKDEKPPLLPPSYNSTNPDEDDLDDYVPPPAVLVGGRETRGKSSTPVTPSYRKPPPYVSP